MMPGRIAYAIWGSTWETPGVITAATIGAASGMTVGTWLTIISLSGALLYFLARMIFKTATERQQVMGELKGISKGVQDNKESLDKQTTALAEQTKALKAIDDRQATQETDVAVLSTRMRGAEARLKNLEG